MRWTLAGKQILANIRNIMRIMVHTAKLYHWLKFQMREKEERRLLELEKILSKLWLRHKSIKNSMLALISFQIVSFQKTLTGETLMDTTLQMSTEIKVTVDHAILFPLHRLLSQDLSLNMVRRCLSFLHNL